MDELKSPEDKTSRRPNCPKCGRKMRRIYMQRKHIKNKGGVFRRRTVSTYWMKLGWWCPYCDHVVIAPQL